MSETNNEKVREHKKIIPIALLDILEKNTDERHVMTMSELQAAVMEKYGISVDRRTIYSTVRMLNDFDIDVVYGQARNGSRVRGYYIDRRSLEKQDALYILKRIAPLEHEDRASYKRIRRAILHLFSTYQAQEIQDALTPDDDF